MKNPSQENMKTLTIQHFASNEFIIHYMYMQWYCVCKNIANKIQRVFAYDAHT